MDLMEDENIVELYLNRDETALTATSEKYGKRLTSLARHVTGDDFTADECVNDTYMEAWNTIPPKEPRTYLYQYLACITRHISLNCCEKENAKKRKGIFVDLSEELDLCFPAPDNTESVVDDIVLKASLNSFLASIDEEKRNIFIRRYWFFDEISELSERFGFSESKIKSILMRLREKLREQLEKDGIVI